MKETSQTDPQLLAMISGLDAESECKVSLRARRSVLGRLLRNGEQKVQRRHNYGLALVAAVCVLVLIAPVVWITVDDLMEGEQAISLSPQIGMLAILLTAALLTALMAGLRENLRKEGGTRRR